MASRVYSPSEVPRLPIRGCTRETCRCRFEAIDPETELSVTQLVERGVHAIRAGRRDLARSVLSHAVSLDEMHEVGWLWLSAVVEDEKKIECLEKVLAINPRNERARAGLTALRKKLGLTERAPTAAPVPEPPKQTAAEQAPAASAEPKEAEAASIPPELDTVRSERSVIVEQWEEFVRVATALDPQMLLVQAQAFLGRFDRLNEQAQEIVAESGVDGAVQIDELDVQWRDTEAIGAALADVLDQYRLSEQASPAGESMHDALQQLAQRILAMRNELREQIGAAGGEVPE
jgi:hypothetical protein